MMVISYGRFGINYRSHLQGRLAVSLKFYDASDARSVHVFTQKLRLAQVWKAIRYS